MSRALLFVLFSTIFFSTMEITLKGMTGTFSAMQVNITRFLLGGIALIPFALRDLRRCGHGISRKDMFELAGLGFIGTVISMTCFQLAVERAPASMVAVIFCCNSVFVLIFAHFMLKARIQRGQLLSLSLAILGILCIINPFSLNVSVEGMLLSLLAPIFFAFYAVLAAPLCHRYSGVVVTCATFILGSLEMIVLIILAYIPPIGSFFTDYGLSVLTNVSLFSGYTWESFLSMLYVGIGVSGAGYAFYFMAAEAASPFTASLVFFFKPVLAPILAFLILGEHIPFNMLLGIMLIVSGSLCSLLARIKSLGLMQALMYWELQKRHHFMQRQRRLRHFSHTLMHLELRHLYEAHLDSMQGKEPHPNNHAPKH